MRRARACPTPSLPCRRLTLATRVHCAVTCAGDPKNLPAPTVTDLRVVVARTLNEPGQWEPLHFVPLKASEALTKELGARAEREEMLKSGFTRGAQLLQAVSHAVAVEAGDEPPALV